MQTVTDGFKAIFASGRQAPEFRMELLESSGYNWPAGITATYTSSGDKASNFDVFAAENLGDGMSAEPSPYLVLDQGITFGQNYKFTGPGMRYNLGWWSDTKSGADKNFATPPWHNTLYSAGLRCNKLRLTTSKAYSGLKIANVTVWYEGENLVEPGHDLGDQDFGSADRLSIILSSWPDTVLLRQVRVSPKQTVAASDYARLLEVEPLLEWSYETERTIESYVSGLEILKSSGQLEAMKPAPPGVGINVCKFRLSAGAGITPTRNQLVRAYIGWDGELLSQGVFIIGEAVPVGLEGWDITAYGHLSLIKDYPYPNTIYAGRTQQSMLTELLTWTGIGASDLVFEWAIIGGVSTNVTWSWYVVEGQDTEKTLADMAEHFGIACFETEDAKIHVRNDYTAASVLTITDDMIATWGATQPEEINRIIVHYSSLTQGKRASVLSASAELAASEAKTFPFKLSRSPCIAMEPPLITKMQDTADPPNDLEFPEILWYSTDAYTLNIRLQNGATAGTATIEMFGVAVTMDENQALYQKDLDESQDRVGIKKREITLFTGSGTQAQTTGDAVLDYSQAAAAALTVTLNRLAPHLQMRDKVTLDSERIGISADYLVANIRLVTGSNETEIDLLPIGGF